MELKIWVEGIQRIVCGVTEATTCQDVVYALAHATGKTGRFMLIEKWRNSERLLAPSEFPLKILLKWGEHSSDVQFSLQRTAALQPKSDSKSHTKSISSNSSPESHMQGISSSMKNRDIKKSLTFSGTIAAPSQLVEDLNESVGDVGCYGMHTDLHPLPIENPLSKNHRLPLARPLAPPLYEVSKGNPSSITSHHDMGGAFHYKSASGIKGQEFSPVNPVRVPPPYSRASQFSKMIFAQLINLHPQGLPPYRNPPPPPAPSHPILVKLNGLSVSQSHPIRINHEPVKSSVGTSTEERHHDMRTTLTSTVAKSQYAVQQFNVINTTNINPHTSPSISTSIHHAKLKENSYSPLRNVGQNSPSLVTLSSSAEHGQPSSESLNHKYTTKSRQLDRTIELAANEKVNRTNGCPEVQDSYTSKLTGDINDNVLTVPDGAEELFEQLVKREAIDSNPCLDSRIGKVVMDSHYRGLVKLVNMQREKLNSQQVDLTKHEAEIAYLDGRSKEIESRIAFLQSQIHQIEQTNQPEIDSECITKLENDLKFAQHSEATLKQFISELEEKYANRVRTLSQMGYQASSLEKQLHMELEEGKKVIEVRTEEEELAILREIEKLQKAVLQANKQVQTSEEISDAVSNEVCELEKMICKKKDEIDVLRQSMKEANLDTLSMTPTDDYKQSHDGYWKPGINRVMKGSPRQLETAVPTSKNPHGVWV